MQETVTLWLELSQLVCQVAWRQHPDPQNGVKLPLQCLSVALNYLLVFRWVGAVLRCANAACLLRRFLSRGTDQRLVV